ncbi:hypothetical protein HYY69_06385 [Candidatus Woesearchaeota archaeon]|nr:hypothetical protein [Candidatus Woesearchaeota archaeon]
MFTVKLFRSLFLIFLLLFLATAVSAVVDLALVDLQATQSAEAYTPVVFQFKIKNTGDKSVVTRLRIQPYTPENYQGVSITDLLDQQLVENVPSQFVVHLSDGSTRIEQVTIQALSGVEIKKGQEFPFTQRVPAIALNPGEYVELESEFLFRGQNIGQIGERQVGLRFVGYQVKMEDGWFVLGNKQELNFNNNEQMATIVVKKRTPLVEQGPQPETEQSPGLETGQYFIHNYEEYWEQGTLCADVAGNEVCALSMNQFDGAFFPFTINAKQAELDWKAKLFYKYIYTDEEPGWLYNTLADFIHFEIDGVTLYLTGAPGWLVEVQEK